MDTSKLLEQAGPYIGQLSFGGLAGFSCAYALKKIGRVALVIFGLLFIALQLMAYFGFVEINWLRIQKVGDPLLASKNLGEGWKALLGVLTQNLPFAGAFIPGFMLGLKMG